MARRNIDWDKTGNKLLRLRSDNPHLRRYVCSALRKGTDLCRGDGDCERCDTDMDNNISRPELALVFNVSDSVIFNWENGKTPVGVEDLLFYCEIAKTTLKKILVFEN